MWWFHKNFEKYRYGMMIIWDKENWKYYLMRGIINLLLGVFSSPR
jgi:hypothetical protein